MAGDNPFQRDAFMLALGVLLRRAGGQAEVTEQELVEYLSAPEHAVWVDPPKPGRDTYRFALGRPHVEPTWKDGPNTQEVPGQ